MAQAGTAMTEEQLAAIVEGWQRLFLDRGLSMAQQDSEFQRIIHARVHAGITSVVAPQRITEA